MTNQTLLIQDPQHSSINHRDKYANHTGETWHWWLIAVFVLICIVGIIGNSLVIYVVTQKPKMGPFRHLNKVVRNLGITDFFLNK